MPWYCKTENGEIGPIDSAKLKELAKQGRISPSTPVRNNPASDWSPASKVKGLFAESLPPPHSNKAIPSEAQKACRFCGESIALAAVKCKHCGEFLDESKRPTSGQPVNVASPQPVQTVIHMAPAPKWSPGVAAVLSFLIPGLGQIYKGQIFNGLIWMVITVIGYVCFVIPGVVLHLCCIVGAASGNPNK